MKKILFIIFIIFVGLFICSCSLKGRLYSNDTKEADEKFDIILTSIQTQNLEEFKKTFSSTAVAQICDFDNEILSVFNYFEGDVIELDNRSGPVVYEANDNDGYHKITYSTYDVKTTKYVYSFYIINTIKDTAKPENEGISSFYMKRYSGKSMPEYAYNGDGTEKIGITIE